MEVCVACKNVIDPGDPNTMLLSNDLGGGYIHRDPCWLALLPWIRKLLKETVVKSG